MPPESPSAPATPPQPDLDIINHPVLGPLKFPKDMGPDERNQIIQQHMDEHKQKANSAPSVSGSIAPPLTSYGAATKYGLSELGGGIADVGKGIYNTFKQPETTGEKALSAVPGALPIYRMGKGVYDLGKQATQIPGAIHDLANSPDPLGSLALAAPRAAGQGVGNIAATAAPEIARGVAKIPAGQIMRTAGKTVANQSLSEPFQATSKIPNYWRESSPEAVAHANEMRNPLRMQTERAIAEGRANPIKMTIEPAATSVDPLLAETKQAVAEGRANRIPTKIKPDAPVTDPMQAATQQAVSEGRAMKIPLSKMGAKTPVPSPANALSQPPVSGDPSAALGSVPTPSAQPIDLRATSQAGALSRPPISGTPSANLGRLPVPSDPYGNLDMLRGKMTNVPSESLGLGEIPPTELDQSEVLGRMGTTAGSKAANRAFMSSNPSALGRVPKMGGGGSTPVPLGPTPAGVNLLPEPRPTFPGENPNYMASVPRTDLGRMAVARKPGAGTQLQQLGEPILYIPDEADYPGPRRK